MKESTFTQQKKNNKVKSLDTMKKMNNNFNSIKSIYLSESSDLKREKNTF
jgi:hypothetical protein